MILYTFAHFCLQFLTRPIIAKRKHIEKSIQTYTTKQDITVLDFGCGEGIFSNILKESQINYVGIDINISFLHFAKKIARNRNRPHIACSEKLSLKEKSIDVVLLNYVLHHMKKSEIIQLCQEIKKVMRKNAFLIIIEMVSRNKQKGIFFKTITYLEEKIKKIIYIEQNFLIKNLGDNFKLIEKNTIRNNSIQYIFKYD